MHIELDKKLCIASSQMHISNITWNTTWNIIILNYLILFRAWRWTLWLRISWRYTPELGIGRFSGKQFIFQNWMKLRVYIFQTKWDFFSSGVRVRVISLGIKHVDPKFHQVLGDIFSPEKRLIANTGTHK